MHRHTVDRQTSTQGRCAWLFHVADQGNHPSVLPCSESHPAEIMNAYYQNQSCDPFTPASRLCELGNFAAYSIRVASAQDVVAGIRFGREKNIRLVVKTTGHE